MWVRICAHYPPADESRGIDEAPERRAGAETVDGDRRRDRPRL
jgi:hypothetical protein